MSFNFHCITEIETMKAIDTLENKSSSGHDGISNKIVKLLKNEISKPLTVIINQMLKTDIFPDSLRILSTPCRRNPDKNMLFFLLIIFV